MSSSILHAQKLAVIANACKQQAKLLALRTKNLPVLNDFASNEYSKRIALAMLCLGEASKYKKNKRTSFSFCNSDPEIIAIFLNLMLQLYPDVWEKLRFTIQCRADQLPFDLEAYWKSYIPIPSPIFYKPQVDKRTIGKPTLKPFYRGVLRIDILKNDIRLELEELASLIYNHYAS